MTTNPFKRAQLALNERAELFIKEQMNQLSTRLGSIMQPNNRFRLHKQYYNGSSKYWSQEQNDEWATLVPIPGYEDDVRLLRLRIDSEYGINESRYYHLIAHNRSTEELVHLILSDVTVYHPGFAIDVADCLFNHLQSAE